MTHNANSPQATALPADDPRRTLTHAHSDSPALRHVSVAGDTYTILVSGADTAGRYCLIDMHVPPGGGPPPHRHDFEEMFSLLEGELAVTFRGETATVRAGSTVNIPANAPHSFRNVSAGAARMLCVATPAGLDAFFLEVGDPVGSRTAPPPHLTPEEIGERRTRMGSLLAKYLTEMVEA
jgi:quercetin dioxygenase-like cupin family protein